MKVGDLVRLRQNTYIGYVGPGTPALVVDIAHSRFGVRILIDGKAIWVAGTMLEAINEAG